MAKEENLLYLCFSEYTVMTVLSVVNLNKGQYIPFCLCSIELQWGVG